MLTYQVLGSADQKIDLKTKKGTHSNSDSDDDKHGWKFKGPKLLGWKFAKEKSGKRPNINGDVDIDANLKGPDADISRPGVDSPDNKGPDVYVSVPRVSGPEIDLKKRAIIKIQICMMRTQLEI